MRVLKTTFIGGPQPAETKWATGSVSGVQERADSRTGANRRMATAPNIALASHGDHESRIYERHYSPSELGELWNLSVDTIRRVFESEPGVMVFENPDRASSRRFRTLRIPESVAQRVYTRLTNCRITGKR